MRIAPHIHSHNSLSACEDYATCTENCHCHFQDERCTPCCKRRTRATAEEFSARLCSCRRPVRKYATLAEVAQGTTFVLYRGSDESGVSGTGKVLEGVIFSDGTVAVRWCTENAPSSTVVYDTSDGTTGWEKFCAIHVQTHPTNSSRIEVFSGKKIGIWEQEPVVEPVCSCQRSGALGGNVAVMNFCVACGLGYYGPFHFFCAPHRLSGSIPGYGDVAAFPGTPTNPTNPTPGTLTNPTLAGWTGPCLP